LILGNFGKVKIQIATLNFEMYVGTGGVCVRADDKKRRAMTMAPT
jgi:hypothetical protein